MGNEGGTYLNNSKATYKVQKQNSLDSNNKKPHKNLKRLIITDVSRMHEDRICIFGVDGETNYIRPIIPYKNVREHNLYDTEGKLVIKPFAMIELELIEPSPNPPHIEDYIMNQYSKPALITNLSPNESKFFLDSILDENVKEIFRTRILNNKFIPQGCGNRSIGTIKVEKFKKIKFSGTNKKFKLRAVFLDQSRDQYDLPITDYAFYKYYHDNLQKDINSYEINQHITSLFNKSDLYFRVGLSRVGNGFKNHYLLITGIYSFPYYKKQRIIK